MPGRPTSHRYSKSTQLETWHVQSDTNGPATEKLLASLPEDIQDTLDETSHQIADQTAGIIQAVAFSDSKQSQLVAPSVVAAYAKVPAVVAGGTLRIPGRQATYSDIFYGANFGAIDYPQFRLQIPKEDYWFFDTFYEQSPRMLRQWATAVEDLADLFNLSGES